MEVFKGHNGLSKVSNCELSQTNHREGDWGDLKRGKRSLLGALLLAASSSSSSSVASALIILSLRVFRLEILLAKVFLLEGCNTDDKLCVIVFFLLYLLSTFSFPTLRLYLSRSSLLPFHLFSFPFLLLHFLADSFLLPHSSLLSFMLFSLFLTLSFLLYQSPLPPFESLLLLSLYLLIPLLLSLGFSLSSSVTIASTLNLSLSFFLALSISRSFSPFNSLSRSFMFPLSCAPSLQFFPFLSSIRSFISESPFLSSVLLLSPTISIAVSSSLQEICCPSPRYSIKYFIIFQPHPRVPALYLSLLSFSHNSLSLSLSLLTVIFSFPLWLFYDPSTTLFCSNFDPSLS